VDPGAVSTSKYVNKSYEASEKLNSLAITVVRVVALDEVPDMMLQVGVMLIAEEGLLSTQFSKEHEVKLGVML
jgi:hypothetical protein